MMIAFTDLPIRTKLLVVITTITFVALILAAAVQTLYYHHASKDRLVAEQLVLARIIADRSTAALAFADQRVAAENLAALGANTAIERACIYDADQALFAGYSRGGETGGGCAPELPTLTEGFGGGRFALSQPILVDDVEIGMLSLQSSLAGLYRQTQADVVVTLIVLVVALLIATISAMRLQRWVSHPILRLAETAALITETQDYRLQAKAAGRDEVGRLVETFNSMVRVVRERDDSLRRSEARYRALVEGISAILYTTEVDDSATAQDGSATTLYISPQVEGILGYAPDAWLHRPELFSERLHDDDRQQVLRMISACWQSGGDFVCEYRMLHRDGHTVHIRDEGKLLRDHGRIVMQGLRYDISERRRAEAKVEHLAYHDALTALPNRLLFKSHLAAAIERAERYGHRFAVHFLDLDRFKDINDSLGHPVGDALLQAVAERLSGVVRRSDSFARFGGDEFAAIQNGIVTSDGASLMAQRFIDALRKPFILGENRVQVGTSVGIVVGGPANLSVDMLMTQADVALYKAKEVSDSSFAFYEDSMTVALRREMQLTNQLPAALEAGELFIQFQPQVDLATTAIVGSEVLARWRHPELGMISPVEFIRIAERHGLIDAIGCWVLDRACEQIAAWQAAGLAPPCTAVNVSSVQFRSPDFADFVLERIATHGIPAASIELEFTESVFLEATDENLGVISRLSERGVRFAIDDFGTGFSSLAYLRKFQVHKLKIDRTFVQYMVERPNDVEIIRATLALGRALGLTTLAEGVETEAQAALLLQLGCAQAQGYYFGRPMSEQDITERLIRQRCDDAEGAACKVESSDRSETQPRDRASGRRSAVSL